MKALVTGITGQDGYYLTKHLIRQGYEVHGLIRRKTEEPGTVLPAPLQEAVLHYGDMTDPESLDTVVREVKPDEVYNLAGQSHVRVSFDCPHYTTLVNGVGVLSLLTAVSKHVPYARFYQASTSEIFGNVVDEDGYQRETTPKVPVSPYGCAKLYAHHICQHYRRAYNMHVCCGILFNHESPRRGVDFVTAKVCKAAVEISLKLSHHVELGDLEARRDWGHSQDYVAAMHAMLAHDTPDDYVIATGETHSVRQLCDVAFSRVGLDYRQYVRQNPKYMRSEELRFLRGDASRAREILGWKPTVTFEQLIHGMVEHWQAFYRAGAGVLGR